MLQGDQHFCVNASTVSTDSILSESACLFYERVKDVCNGYRKVIDKLETVFCASSTFEPAKQLALIG